MGALQHTGTYYQCQNANQQAYQKRHYYMHEEQIPQVPTACRKCTWAVVDGDKRVNVYTDKKDN